MTTTKTLNIHFDASALNEKYATRYNQIVELLKSGALYHDTHHESNPHMEMPHTYFIVHRRGIAVEICPFFDEARYFSINPLMAVDGELHLSSWSCGGAIQTLPDTEEQLKSLVADGVIAGYIQIV